MEIDIIYALNYGHFDIICKSNNYSVHFVTYMINKKGEENGAQSQIQMSQILMINPV